MKGSSSRTATHAAMHVKVIGFRSFFTYRWWLKAIAADMFKIAALIASTVTCAASSTKFRLANQATAPSSAINTVFIKHYVVIA